MHHETVDVGFEELVGHERNRLAGDGDHLGQTITLGRELPLFVKFAIAREVRLWNDTKDGTVMDRNSTIE